MLEQEALMKCERCNSNVPEAAKFCPECGATIRQSVFSAEEKARLEAQGWLLWDETQSPGDREPRYKLVSQKEKPSSKRGKVLIYGAIIIFLLLIVGSLSERD